MKKELEVILIAAILEVKNSSLNITKESFSAAASLMLNAKDVFEKVPKHVYISSDDLKETEKIATVGLMKDLKTNYGKKNYESIKYFDSKGILLHDGIHASVFGRMNYIYRSKGIRVYLLQNKDFIVVAPYCYIDHRGFQLDQEEFYRVSLKELNNDREIIDLLNHTKVDFDKPLKVNQQLIKSLISIKKQFDKLFYLEYLLVPPDVDEVSEFSKTVRGKLWDICLSEAFRKKWGNEMQESAMNYLSFLNISPSSGQLIKFLKSHKEKDSKIIEKLELLEKNLLAPKTDIFEFKPNISGIGINGNEIYRRITESIKKLK